MAFGLIFNWPIFGYVFGFFQASLRGRTALQKAAAVLLTISVPPLVNSAFWGRADFLTSWAWWFAQTVVISAILAFAIDYRLARKGGFTRSEYMDLRGLTTLLSGGGVIVAGLITFAFALLQGPASQFIDQVLTFSRDSDPSSHRPRGQGAPGSGEV